VGGVLVAGDRGRRDRGRLYRVPVVIARSLAFVVALALAVVAAAFGQQLYVGPTHDLSPRWATAADFDGSILFCRGYYASDREEPNGAGWWTDYPGADNNFLVRLSELTEVRVRFDRQRIPFYVVLKLDDPLLFKCPILRLEDVGTLRLGDAEIRTLRAYLQKGGFVWADDFWGSEAWAQWEEEIRRVLPRIDYDLVDLGPDHPIFHQLYDLPHGIWQQPSVGLWQRHVCPDPESGDEGGCYAVNTSERGADSATPHLRALVDRDTGRIPVVMTFNTDIADGWEDWMDRQGPQAVRYSDEFSARSYALGVNIYLYALTH